jgi:hypothetical protein
MMKRIYYILISFFKVPVSETDKVSLHMHSSCNFPAMTHKGTYGSSHRVSVDITIPLRVETVSRLKNGKNYGDGDAYSGWQAHLLLSRSIHLISFRLLHVKEKLPFYKSQLF